MGLGNKIKNALHGDQDRRTAVSNVKAPGAYPSEEYLGKPSDGRSGPNESKKLHKDSEEYDVVKAESPKSDSSQRSWDSGVGGIGKADTRDRTSTGGYWGDMDHGNKMATKDLPDRSRYQSGNDTADVADRHHDPRVADQAVGGGVYNGVTGSGSHNYEDGNSGQFPTGAVHDPLMSSTQGMPVASDDGYDNDDFVQKNNSPSSHNDFSSRRPNGRSLNGRGLNGRGLNGRGLNGRGLNGRGLKGKGMTIGVGAVGANGAHEEDQTIRDNYTYDHPQQPYSMDGGVPKTTMLDPEPATTSPTHNASPRGAGFSSPRSATSTQNSSGSSMPTSPNNRGKDHFGPGHEGAKVLHQCEHCGNDNDISRYFRNDVVYRLGS